MFARVHESTEIKTGNSGSCFALAKYLDKEAEQENVVGDTCAERETSSRLVHYLDKEEGNNFFSSTPGKYDMAEVIANIDANKKHLGKDDTKFYMLTINPSVEEQKHLIGEDIDDFHSLSKEKQDTVKQKLVELTRASMDAYARNFGRKNVNSGDDLLYYARIETQRTYKKNSEEVRNGTAKAGDLKPGLNLHIHVIVSRNSKNQKTRLSPHVKSRGNSWVLNGEEVKRGFNHEMWKQEVQHIFNEKFDYVSKDKETYVPQKSSFKRLFDAIKEREHRRETEFKQWFGDYEKTPEHASRIVDEKGTPLKVYHSTKRHGKKFKAFNTERPAWFTPDKEYSLLYFKDRSCYEKGDVYCVYLNVKNPADIGDIDRGIDCLFSVEDWYKELEQKTGIPYDDIKEKMEDIEGLWLYQLTNTKEFKELLQEHGYDGIKAEERGHVSYAAFEPEQIRNVEDVHFTPIKKVESDKVVDKKTEVDNSMPNRGRATSGDSENTGKTENTSVKEESQERPRRRVPSRFVGTVTVRNSYGVDTIHFTDKKDFLRTVEEKMKSENKDKWSFEVLTKLPSVRKNIDDIFCRTNGKYNDTPFAWYRNNKGFAMVNQQDYKLNQYVGAIAMTENGSAKYTYYTDKEQYLKDLKKSVENKTWVGYTTFTPNASIRKQADDMAFEFYGRKNPCPKERYEEMENWRTVSAWGDRYCAAVYVRKVTKESMNEKIKNSDYNKNKTKTENVKKAGKMFINGGRNGKTPMISIASEIKKRAKKEILKDNFQTERAIIGKTSMIIRTLSNPAASVKQMIISEIKNMLNPVKEL